MSERAGNDVGLLPAIRDYARWKGQEKRPESFWSTLGGKLRELLRLEGPELRFPPTPER